MKLMPVDKKKKMSEAHAKTGLVHAVLTGIGFVK